MQRFEQTYRRNIDGIVGYFARRCRDPQAVADLTAETFARAVDEFPAFARVRRSERAWLLGIAEATFEQRRQPAAAATDTDPPGRGRRPLDELEIAELTRRIDAERGAAGLIARSADLPAAERAAFEFVDLEGLAPGDAAAVLGISRIALRRRLTSARSRLRDPAGDQSSGAIRRSSTPSSG